MSDRPGKLNNHLEAAIHEAMSELDKMSGTVSICAFPLFSCTAVSPAFTTTPFPLCVPSDPVERSSGEAPQAEEEEDIQITLNVLAQERPQSLSETLSVQP